MKEPTVIKVESDRWKKAQNFELNFAQNTINKGDDHNFWWKKQFDHYKAIHKMVLPSILEVGCGPHTNIRLILPFIQFKSLYLEDPLLDAYLKLKSNRRIMKLFHYQTDPNVSKIYKKHNATLLTEPLENLSLPDNSIDLCVCINVLDHVHDSDMCLAQMKRVTKKGGVIILGQDLSNEDDQKLCPESWEDIGHPIKVDHSYLDKQFEFAKPLFKKILPREQGRNPRCHYGTYLLIAQK